MSRFCPVVLLILVLSLLIAACAAPTPQVIREVVKETVVVQQTGQVPVQLIVTATPTPLPPEAPASPDKPVELRLGVTLTAEELKTYSAAIDALQAAHPEWRITLEQTPQSGQIEKINSQLAADTLPDVYLVQGIFAQQWIRQKAFVDLDAFIQEDKLDMSDFYPGTIDQFTWQGRLWGIPNTAAPDVLYYNKTMFDAAGLAYPTNEWTFDDMRAAAKKLTLDKG
jgi:multiple sugar transport system substrate-binding protein